MESEIINWSTFHAWQRFNNNHYSNNQTPCNKTQCVLKGWLEAHLFWVSSKSHLVIYKWKNRKCDLLHQIYIKDRAVWLPFGSIILTDSKLGEALLMLGAVPANNAMKFRAYTNLEKRSCWEEAGRHGNAGSGNWLQPGAKDLQRNKRAAAEGRTEWEAPNGCEERGPRRNRLGPGSPRPGPGPRWEAKRRAFDP